MKELIGDDVMIDGRGWWQMMVLRKGMNVDVDKERGNHEAHPPPPHADSSNGSFLAFHHTWLRKTGSDLPKSLALEVRNDRPDQGFGSLCDYETTEQQNQLSNVPYFLSQFRNRE